MKDVAKRTEELAEQTKAVKTKLDLHEKQQVLDIKALECIDIQLSDTMHSVSDEDLIKAIRVASPETLENIFQRAKEARHRAWLQKHEGKEAHQLTERTIPIFQGLLASRYGANRHRYHAQLGYALKDQQEQDWAGARDCLEQAIGLLKESGRPMSPFYQFNWALCTIELDQKSSSSTDDETRQAIAAALKQGSTFWKLKNAILESERVQAWLDRNGLSFNSIGLIQAPVHNLHQNVTCGR